MYELLNERSFIVSTIMTAKKNHLEKIWTTNDRNSMRNCSYLIASLVVRKYGTNNLMWVMHLPFDWKKYEYY